MIRKCLLWPLLIMGSFSAQAFELTVEPVTGNLYALVGEIGPRSSENHALNNTMGFVVTDKGVVLIGSGASPSGAQLIEKAIRQVTDQPVHTVINIGAQDHHWLGNSYFLAKGAEILALERTVTSQKQHVDSHLTRLGKILVHGAEQVTPHYATRVYGADIERITIGGVNFELIWPGDSHFSGDAILWLPESRAVFAGDLVFHDRMLGIQPFTPVTSWQKAFHTMAALEPAHVIPGHGHPGNLSKARRDTGNYLDWLVSEISIAVDDWKELDETVELLSEAPDFKHLTFFEGWHKRNINQTFVQIERTR